MEQILFYPNGNSQGFPVSSRNEIKEILRSNAKIIDEIDIVHLDDQYRVLARMEGDASWFDLGEVSNELP